MTNANQYSYAMLYHGTVFLSVYTTSTNANITGLLANTTYGYEVISIDSGTFGNLTQGTFTTKSTLTDSSFDPSQFTASDSINSNVTYSIGNEENWFLPRDNGMLTCFTFNGLAGGRIITDIEGDYSMMRSNQVTKDYDEIEFGIWLTPNVMNSTDNGNMIAATPPNLSRANDCKYLDGKLVTTGTQIGGYSLAEYILKMVSVNETMIPIEIHNLNVTIPQGWHIVVDEGQYGDCWECAPVGQAYSPTGWLDGEMQAHIISRLP